MNALASAKPRMPFRVRLPRLFLHGWNLLALVGIGSCGTADPGSPGRCSTADSSGAVASNKDSEGKPWTLKLNPESRSIQCNAASVEGIMTFVSSVEDSSGTTIAGVSIGASVPEFSGLRLVTKKNIEEFKDAFKNRTSTSMKIFPTDESTDRCGTAIITVVYTCPPEPGTSVGGDLTVFSGPLFSEPAQITITLTEPEEEEKPSK